MEENEKKEENEKSFKTVKNPNTYKNIYNSSTKSKLGFGKGILLPFLSGVVCSLVIRYLFWSSIYSQQNFKFKLIF